MMYESEVMNQVVSKFGHFRQKKLIHSLKIKILKVWNHYLVPVDVCFHVKPIYSNSDVQQQSYEAKCVTI